MKVKFYVTSLGWNPVEGFIKAQSDDIRADFVDALNLLESGKWLSMPLSRNLSSIHHGLHELRLKDRTGQIRIFYYIKREDAIYMLHAFKKKTQEIPKKELKIILKRIREV
jgi:phage-related protein